MRENKDGCMMTTIWVRGRKVECKHDKTSWCFLRKTRTKCIAFPDNANNLAQEKKQGK